MIKLNKFITKQAAVNLDSQNITLTDLDNIYAILAGNVKEGEQFEFELKDVNDSTKIYRILNENGTSVIKLDDQAVDSKSFLEFIAKEGGILLDSQNLKQRLITLTQNTSDELKEKINSLKLGVDSNLLNQIKSVETELKDLQSKAGANLNEEQKDKYSRLQEVNSRIDTIQAQVDFYQNEKKLKEELNSKIKKLSADKNNIQQMMQSVELLIQNREDLSKKLEAFKNISQTPEQIAELKNRKINYLNSQMFTNKPILSSINEEEEQEKKNSFKLGLNFTVVFIFLNVLITFMAFMYSYNGKVMLTGLFTSILLVVIYFISRFFNQTLEEFDLDLKVDRSAMSTEKPVEQPDPNTDLFINSAWASALKNELDTIDQTIQKNLNGKTFDTLKADSVANETETAVQNKKLEELNSKSITSDEYYKKRRECDILKIEKENIEFGLKMDPEVISKIAKLTETLANLNKKLAYSNKLGENFPVFVSTSLDFAQFSALKGDLYNQTILVKAN